MNRWRRDEERLPGISANINTSAALDLPLTFPLSLFCPTSRPVLVSPLHLSRGLKKAYSFISHPLRVFFVAIYPNMKPMMTIDPYAQSCDLAAMANPVYQREQPAARPAAR